MLAYLTDKLLQYPRRVECPECSELVPTPAPMEIYLRAVRILVRAQTALIQKQDKIVIERTVGSDALVLVLDALAEVLHEEIDDQELMDRILARTHELDFTVDSELD